MDLNQIQLFTRVVESGSFTAAAKALALPTSSVSRGVMRLESELGTRLLQRTTRKLHLTEAGTAYYHHAALGLGYMLEAEAAIDEARQQPQGRLKVTAPADLGDSLLAGLIEHTQRAFPALEVELLLTDRYIDLVDGGAPVEAEGEALDDDARRIERLTLLLRTREGVPASAIAPSDQEALAGLVQARHDRLVLTLRGRLLANEVALRLR